MGIYGARQLLNRGIRFKRFSWLLAFLNGLFIAGIPVLIHDLFFLVITSIRWAPVYPQYATLDFWFCFPRDIMGILLCYLVTQEFYGIYSLNRKTWLGFYFLWTITGIVFAVAPTMGITNWTYAITQGMSDTIILVAFSINFLFGKPFLIWIYTTLWKRKE